jgi:hypothetical protein
MNAASSVSESGEATHRFPLTFARPEVLAEPHLVVADERVGEIEDVPVRAIVLLELDQRHWQPGYCEIPLEVLHVRDVCAAKRVDRLVVVADGEDRGRGTG